MSTAKKAGKGKSSRRVRDAGDASIEEIESPSLELARAEAKAAVPGGRRGKPPSNNDFEDLSGTARSEGSPSRGTRKKKSRLSAEQSLLVSETSAGPADDDDTGALKREEDLDRKPGVLVNGKVAVAKQRQMEDEYTLGHSTCCGLAVPRNGRGFVGFPLRLQDSVLLSLPQ